MEAVMAVGEHVGHGELLHAGGARRLDDADIGDVVAGQAVKAHAQMLHIAAFVVRGKDTIGDRALFSLFLGHSMTAEGRKLSRIGDDGFAANQIYAAVVELHHTKNPFRLS